MASRKTDPEPFPVRGTPTGYRNCWEADDSALIQAQIAERVYPSGSRLPSSRALAADLGVSRTTVTAAYEQLAAEGYLEARQGARPQVPKGLRVEQPVTRQGVEALPARLSDFGQRLAGLPMHRRPETDAPVADFRYGELAASEFPTLTWKRAIDAAILRRSSRVQ